VASLKKKARSRGRLSPAQVEVAAKFSDHAFDNPNLTFDEIAEKELVKPFPKTPNGRKFRAECKAVFDLERKA
jgi:hypothetical protein